MTSILVKRVVPTLVVRLSRSADGDPRRLTAILVRISLRIRHRRIRDAENRKAALDAFCQGDVLYEALRPFRWW